MAVEVHNIGSFLRAYLEEGIPSGQLQQDAATRPDVARKGPAQP